LFGHFDSGNFFRAFSVSGNFCKVRSGIQNSGHLGDTNRVGFFGSNVDFETQKAKFKWKASAKN